MVFFFHKDLNPYIVMYMRGVLAPQGSWPDGPGNLLGFKDQDLMQDFYGKAYSVILTV